MCFKLAHLLSKTKTPISEQPPDVRVRNFKEVCMGYTIEEAARCLRCEDAPCIAGCPVEIDIPAFIEAIHCGDMAKSVEIMAAYTNLPAVCGRVCLQETQCEGLCRLGKAKDFEPVAIGKLERLAADQNYARGKPAVTVAAVSKTSGGKIAVVGSGPALTRINLMRACEFPDYDTPAKKSRRVAVIGGGNVAMDAARSAKRLGAEKVAIVYRRSLAELPARIEEYHHAVEEGIEFHWLSNPKAYSDDGSGKLKGVDCVRMEIGEPDESGRRRPIPAEGGDFFLEADTAIEAIGQEANRVFLSAFPELKLNKRGYIEADERTGATSVPGVFAGGDIVTGAATVILAMGAAAAMDEYVRSGMNKISRQAAL